MSRVWKRSVAFVVLSWIVALGAGADPQSQTGGGQDPPDEPGGVTSGSGTSVPVTVPLDLTTDAWQLMALLFVL